MLAKDKLNTKEVFISGALNDSYNSHDKFASVNVLREYDNRTRIEQNKNRTRIESTE